MFYSQFRNALRREQLELPLTQKALEEKISRQATNNILKRMEKAGGVETKKSVKRFRDSLPVQSEARQIPQCPPGYKFNKKNLRCEPIRDKDTVSGTDSRDSHPSNGPGYNTWGSHGMNGAPYAYAEPATGYDMGIGVDAIGGNLGAFSESILEGCGCDEKAKAKRKASRAKRLCKMCGAIGGCGCATYANQMDKMDDATDADGGDGGGGMGEAVNFNLRAKQIARQQQSKQKNPKNELPSKPVEPISHKPVEPKAVKPYSPKTRQRQT